MKRQASARLWVGGTVVVAVLLLAAAWLLLVSPVLAGAAEDSAQSVQQRDQNDLLQIEITKLTEQSTHLAEYQAELATLRLQMPTTGDGASISRELQSLATTAGVTIVSVAPSVPEAFVPPATATTTATTDSAAAETATDGTGEVASTDAPAAATPAGVSGLYVIPITLTSVGSYDSSVAFLRAVQTQASRLYLVSSINALTQDDEGASGGRPATVKGDIELTMTGYAYVLLDSAATVEDPAADDAVTLPTPTDQQNPFTPVG